MKWNSRARLACATPLLTLAALLLATGASAKPYPTNKCVSVKQTEAGRYCRLVLKAWSQWEASGDAARRDAAIANALARLERRWLTAEEDAAARDTECQQTTLSTAEVATTVAAAAEQIVDAVNGGLDLGDRKEATCGRKLLEASGELCRRLLRAEGDYIDEPAKDAHGARRAGAARTAVATFDRLFARWQSGPACPSTASADGVRALVRRPRRRAGHRHHGVAERRRRAVHDDLADRRDPVPQGSDYSAVCMDGSPYHFFVKRGSVNKAAGVLPGRRRVLGAAHLLGAGVRHQRQSERRRQPEQRRAAASPTSTTRTTRSATGTSSSCRTAAATSTSATRQQNYSAARRAPRLPERARRREVGARALPRSRRGVRHRLERRRLRRLVQRAAAARGVAGRALQRPRRRRQRRHHAGLPRRLLPELELRGEPAGQHPRPARRRCTNGTGIPGYTKVVANYFPDTNWAHYCVRLRRRHRRPDRLLRRHAEPEQPDRRARLVGRRAARSTRRCARRRRRPPPR